MEIERVETFINVPGGSVFVRWWHTGQEKRAPLFLLHDSLGSVELWRDFPEALAAAAGRDVIAYDRLGFGRSTPRSGRPSVNFIAEEAEIYFPAILEQLNVRKFLLFGHSVGGEMSLEIAAALPEACEAVISESAQAFVEEHTLAGVRAARAQFADSAQFEKIVRWHGDKARWVLDAWTEVWLSPGFSTWSLDACLEKVKCPVLAIHGDRDEYGSLEFPRRIASKVSGPAQLVILENCGHLPHREKREEVLRLVASFLGQVPED